MYLGEVEDVRMVDDVQGVNGSFEGVDLLVGISDQDFPTLLRQHHVHND